MLHRLHVTNYALIENLNIDFSDGLTIITGETGAGKSILLGALAMILGQRADANALLNKQKKCVVEGEFKIENYSLKDFFQQQELDYEEHTIIRREISPEGKSRAFVNDTPVNLSQLKELAIRLVDIHSQHENLTLNNSAFQLSVVDVYAQHKELLEKYQAKYKAYLKSKSLLEDLLAKEKQSKSESDYFQFQFNELEEAKLKADEQEKLEQELATLNNAEEIKSALARSFYQLDGSEINLLIQLAEINNSLAALAKYNPTLQEILVRLKSSQIELKDIAAEIEILEQKIQYSPQRIEEINERLNIIYHLQQKHRASTIAELLVLQNELSEKLFAIQSLDEEIQSLNIQVNEAKNELLNLAKRISKNRKEIIPSIENQIKKLLKEVGMPNGVLKIESTELDNKTFNENGIDKIRFLFSANKGIDYKELNKVASGGELSRLMLCIKSLIAKLMALPTIIFDEIDSGVSGEVAFKVGNVMSAISEQHQVISITHLPQIASKGDAHYFVYKEISGNKTITKMKQLNRQERINEIAQMLGGEKPTAIAVENAKEMLSLTQKIV